MATKVGIQFYVDGAAAVDRDIKKIGKSLGSAVSLGDVAKGTLAFLGIRTSLRMLGREAMDFYSEAIANSKEATTQIQALNNSWAETKRLLGSGLGNAMAPFYRDINGVVQSINVAIRDATELQNLFGKLSSTQQAAVSSQYEQQTGKAFGYQDVKTATSGAFSLTGSYSASNQTTRQFVAPDDQILAYNLMKGQLSSDEINGVSQAQESARAKVVSLNEAMGNQIRVQRELNSGNRDASQILSYQMTLEEAYAGDMEIRDRKMKYYLSDLEKLNKLRSEGAADKYIKDLQQEQDYIELIQQGRKDEAEILRTVNRFKSQGIDLTQAEIDGIQQLQEENRKLSDHYGNNFGSGAKSAIRELQDEMYTLGDIGHDVTIELHDDLTSELNDALWETEDLGDAFESAAKSAAKMATQMMLSNAITNAMGAGQNFVGSLFGSERGNAFLNGRVVPFEKGGVVSSPTLFPLGIMGEKNKPEGVLPLTRNSQGRLGVESTGSGSDPRTIATLERIADMLGNQRAVLPDAVMESWAHSRSGRGSILRIMRENS